MSFIRRTPSQAAGSDHNLDRLSNFILNIGSITDDITHEICFGGLADIRATRRRLAQEAEKAAPGYRDELNKLRARHGLPPL
jgi:hypothetical protein